MAFSFLGGVSPSAVARGVLELGGGASALSLAGQICNAEPLASVARLRGNLREFVGAKTACDALRRSLDHVRALTLLL